MNNKRIQVIQSKTPYPNSISVAGALKQVWNEVEQENTKQTIDINCSKCKHEKLSKIFFPCNECSNSFLLRFEEKEKNKNIELTEKEIIFIKKMIKNDN